MHLISPLSHHNSYHIANVDCSFFGVYGIGTTQWCKQRASGVTFFCMLSIDPFALRAIQTLSLFALRRHEPYPAVFYSASLV